MKPVQGSLQPEALELGPALRPDACGISTLIGKLLVKAGASISFRN